MRLSTFVALFAGVGSLFTCTQAVSLQHHQRLNFKPVEAFKEELENQHPWVHANEQKMGRRGQKLYKEAA
jgi:hypothetical protein